MSPAWTRKTSARALAGEEVPELLRFLNDVFRPNVSAPLEVSFPLFFGDPHAKLDDFRVLVHDGKIVSHVGVCEQKAVVGAAELSVAWIGAVATDPAYRSRGCASLLLGDALDVLRDRECHVALLNGPRRLYGRFGFDLAGAEFAFRLSAHCVHGLADVDARIWRYGGAAEDVAHVAAAHDAEVVRISRTRSETEKLLRVPLRSTYCASTGADFAYVVVDQSRIGHRSGSLGVVLDFGGELGLVVRLLEYAFTDDEFETLSLHAGRANDECCQLFAQIADGYTLGPFANLRVVSLGGLLEKMRPVISERYAALQHPGASTFEIEWYEDDQLRERVCLELESGTVRRGHGDGVVVRVDSLGLVQLLFGPRLAPAPVRLSRQARELVEALFPLNLYAAPIDRQ